MDYFAQGTGYITIPQAQRQAAYQALCQLNFNNFEKQGIIPISANTQPNSYSWDYLDVCKNLVEVLTALGFKVREEGDILYLSYNKVVQKILFLEALKPYITDGFINWVGEEGDVWHNEY